MNHAVEVMGLTDIELRIEVAKILGADAIRTSTDEDNNLFAYWRNAMVHEEGWRNIPDYPNDIAAAWKLLERMCSLYGAVELATSQNPIDQEWRTFARWVLGSGEQYSMVGDAAHAITRLFVLGGKEWRSQ